MAGLASRCLVQNFFIRTSARIWDVGLISLSPMSEFMYVRTYWGSKGHTGVGLVSKCDRLSSVILSPHFLQTTAAYTPDLEHLAV